MIDIRIVAHLKTSMLPFKSDKKNSSTVSCGCDDYVVIREKTEGTLV